MSVEKGKKKSLLDRLRDGILIGDGGYVIALEKRGYVKAGPYTPEAVIENPDAVRQLHREFLRAGSDVIQAFTFYSSEDKLKFGGNLTEMKQITCENITRRGCQIAIEEAAKTGALVAGNISQSPAYTEGKGKEYIQKEIKKQIDIFVECEVDFIICEFYTHVEEMLWVIEEAKKGGLPLITTMCIGKLGDEDDVPPGECAIRMAKAGADVVGVNCFFDPYMTIETIAIMKEALDSAGLNPFLITQPNGFFTTGTGKGGYCECPEYPLAMESRVVTRFDIHRYARAAYDVGVRYIGGCCGFEAYHIRAIAEELSAERGGILPPASEKHEPWGAALSLSVIPAVRCKASRNYWEELVPVTGRPTK